MKAILAGLLLLGSMNAMATKGPFSKQTKDILTKSAMDLEEYSTVVGSTLGKAEKQAASSDGSMSKRSFRATFDTAVDGTAIGAYGLGIYLPANAVVTESFEYTITQFTDSGSGTVAYSCEDANNLKTAADVTGYTAGTVTSGIDSADIASNHTDGIAAECEITATIATVSQMTGKAVFFGSYFVAE